MYGLPNEHMERQPQVFACVYTRSEQSHEVRSR
jgi:hypothetical protein